MQTTKNTSRNLRKLLGAVVAGAFAIAPMASVVAPAQAAPPANERVVYQTLEGVVTVDRQNNRQFVLRLNNGQRVQVRSDEREPRRLSEGDRVRVRGSYRRNDRNVFRADSVQILTNQNTNNNTSFTGRVSRVDSDQRFDIVVGNTTYNVTTTNRLPRRLDSNDKVRVYGRRDGNNNNITNARVELLKDSKDDNKNYRTFTGRVINERSDQRFDLVVGNRTYNVFTTSRLPRRLSNGDTVRVYGLYTDGNDITNATVTAINNNNDNNNNSNDYRTYTGIVRNQTSEQRFDLVVGNTTYNVTTSNRVPRGFDNGDTVRVYGRRSGDNDIVNATAVITTNR